MIQVTIGTKSYSLVKVLGVGAAILAGTGAMLKNGESIAGVWPHVAWKSKAGHTVDIETIEAGYRAEIERLEGLINDGIMATGESVDNFRNEWKCDEWREELDALLEKVEAGSATAQDRDRIRVLQEKMGPVAGGGLNCAQYED